MANELISNEDAEFLARYQRGYLTMRPDEKEFERLRWTAKNRTTGKLTLIENATELLDESVVQLIGIQHKADYIGENVGCVCESIDRQTAIIHDGLKRIEKALYQLTV